MHQGSINQSLNESFKPASIQLFLIEVVRVEVVSISAGGAVSKNISRFVELLAQAVLGDMPSLLGLTALL